MKRIKDITKAQGAELVLDLVGVNPTLTMAAQVSRVLGHITIVGLGNAALPVNFNSPAKECSVASPFWGTIPELIEVISLAQTGKIKMLVEHFAARRRGARLPPAPRRQNSGTRCHHTQQLIMALQNRPPAFQGCRFTDVGNKIQNGNRVMLCSERRVAPLVHCGSQAWVTAEKQGELGESGVQILDAPQGFGRLQTRVVAGECDELRLLSVRWCGRLGGVCVAACGCLGLLDVVSESADTPLYSLIRPNVQAA